MLRSQGAVKVLADTLDARTPGTFVDFMGNTWGRVDRRLKGGAFIVLIVASSTKF